MRSFAAPLLSALALASAAQAGTILRADESGGNLFIHGAGFGTFAPPLVQMGGSSLAVTSYSATDIVATLPAVIPASYLLVVHSFTAGGSSADRFDATIGAVGPAGPAGAQGATGATGPAGATGATGPAGPTGEPGAQGTPGSAGADGATGPAGPAGPAGATGPAGPPGPSTPDARFGNNTNPATISGSGATCTIGQILLTAGPAAVGLPANGQCLAISTNPTLFELIGTTFGGDGTTMAPNGLTYSICDLGAFPAGR
jgi:hypothetical protein